MESTARTAKPLFTNRDLTRLMIPLVIEQLLLMTRGIMSRVRAWLEKRGLDAGAEDSMEIHLEMLVDSY